MPTLVLGANTTLTNPQCNVTLSSPLKIGNDFGALWLPLDGSRQVVTSPAYLHETKDWATVNFNDNSANWTLDLTKVFEQHHAQLLQLIVYEYVHPDMALPAIELNNVSLKVACSNSADIDYQFTTPERHVKASIIFEIYQRNGQYKCRALAENSTQSLASFAQKLQISLDARHPSVHGNLYGNLQGQQQPNARPHPQAGETWTGTAFAIDPYHLLTCEHVIDGAKLIGLRQQGYPDMEAQVVLADEGSDTALLKVNQPLLTYLPLREKGYDLLGESVTAMGFPLTGLGSQLQVTQGNIAGLQGLHNDIRFLQFTAPIQPGSSGSPLLLPTGEVVGMVTHTISNAQNMNYATKYQLLSALVASGGLNLADLIHQNISTTPLSTPQLTKQSKNALWLVGCEA